MTQIEKISAIGMTGFFIGIAAGIIYATNTGKSKLGWAILGSLTLGTAAGAIAKLTIE